MNKLLLASFLILLQGCSLFTAKPPATVGNKSIGSLPEHWVIRGKIGWNSPADRGSASLYWQQQSGEFTLKLFGPLGQGGGTVSGNDSAITIQPKGEEPLYSEQPEALMQEVFGFYVPIDHLRYWAKGISHPEAISRFALDKNKELSSHQSDSGWQIDYSRLANIDGWQLPHKLVMTQQASGIVVKLIISRWQLEKNKS